MPFSQYLVKSFMKRTIGTTIKTNPVFLYLLSIFFVLHGYTENYDFVPVKDALLLTGLYLGSSLLISVLFWLLYRDFRKAGLMAFLIMAYHFFFGSIHDTLKNILPGSFIIKYTFLLPVSFLILLFIIILLKKKKPALLRATYYLNLLLLLFLIVDSVLLAGKMVKKEEKMVALPIGFINCDSCSKPDLYFIIPDEYAGNHELKNLFNFDNSDFINQLSQRGFHTIPASYSNYNYTPFSIASVLNMDYLDLKGKDRSKPDLTYCYEMIQDNKVLHFLQSLHYTFYNYSHFNFKGQPARVLETFLPAKTRLITGQTFLSRLDRDIRFNLITRFQSKRELRRGTYANKENNENIFHLTMKTASEKDNSPKFIFTHLMLPHYPYYFDKNGRKLPFEQLTEGNQVNQHNYIEYLQYTNKRLLELVDHILRSSEKPPIIILMGDHGFRHFTQLVESKYYFLNLMSVYLPSKNYTALSDSLTCVNLFRTVLNTEFGQRLPYLKDSTSYLRD